MEQQHQDSHSFSVIWREQKFVVEINPDATLKQLGDQLQKLTKVKADTLRLLVPMEKSSTMLYPFSDQHSHLSLEAISVRKGKPIRMMGVLEDEIDEFLQNAKVDLRIAGFDEEEKRLRQKNLDRPNSSWKLPQGTYVFCDFRTLSIPGIEFNPPASKALELLHMLASDPGIVAIMNKHHWRVGILTEMAPIGYVGVSPKCILGVNKNHGEEISLRLRTDDLKGFRKYDSIKKTLLHELAHMVYSEHDANFYALDKQLNKEAATLDWTKSRSHTLSGFPVLQHYKEEYNESNVTSSQKLGGQASILPNARASSVSAAYQRLVSTSTALLRSPENASDPEPDVDDDDKSMEFEPYVDSEGSHANVQVRPDNSQMSGIVPALETERCEVSNTEISGSSLKNNAAIGPNCSGEVQKRITALEPEFDDCGANTVRLDQTDPLTIASIDLPSLVNISSIEPEPNDSQVEVMPTEPNSSEASSRSQTIQPDPDYQKLQIIQDPVALVCGRLQNAIQSLKNVVNPSEAGTILHTLIKIISNVIEHPNELKFKKLRKANPVIHRNIVRYEAAMDILILIGFCEDVIIDEIGKAESFLVLKRNDPGLLWLVKSSLETHIA